MLLVFLVCFMPEMKQSLLSNNPYPYGISPYFPILFSTILRATMLFCGISLLKGLRIGRTILVWSVGISFIVYILLASGSPKVFYRFVISIAYLCILYSRPVSRYFQSREELSKGETISSNTHECVAEEIVEP